MGRPFGKEKWYAIDDLYDKELEAYNNVSVKRLEEVARVSDQSAETDMYYYGVGLIVPP